MDKKLIKKCLLTPRILERSYSKEMGYTVATILFSEEEKDMLKEQVKHAYPIIKEAVAKTERERIKKELEDTYPRRAHIGELNSPTASPDIVAWWKKYWQALPEE